MAEVIQRVQPDILLINEFDYDASGQSLSLFKKMYLAKPQATDLAAMEYPYSYVAPVNTGVASGHDLDRNGKAISDPGSRGYGNDCFGYGEFPGQYGMVILSKYPIDQSAVRTFQNFLWKDMPGALLPTVPDSNEPWYAEDELAILRLSSKSHWDVPITLPSGRVIHVLASHPTPPVFDGPEDRNGKRNHDEVRFWVDYVTSNESAAYIYDDQGNRGGLPPGRSFVIMGDLNADVSHGSGPKQAIQALIDHPKINDPKPTSPGAIEQARTEQTRGYATADFSDPNPGNLRADYVLPSADLTLQSSGVFWPNSQHPLARLVQMRPEPATSDHRLVWIDVSPP